MIVYNNIESGMTEVYLGNVSITQVYIGSNKVFPSDVPPTPTGAKFSATYIGGQTYSLECNSSSYLNENETKRGNDSFTSMTDTVIGDCVTTIGSWAFYGCSSLTSVTIPNSVTTIGSYAFSECRVLKRVNSNTDGLFNIPSGVTTIGSNAFNNCRSLSSVTLTNSLTTIDINAFTHCDNLKSIDIPNSVTIIGNGAFSYCSGLTSIDIPNSVTTIGNNAFSFCSGLTSVTIGSGVTSIGDLAFVGCYGLTSITINATTPPTISNHTFINTNNCPIYVPCQSLETYKSATFWSIYADRITCIQPSHDDEYLTFIAEGNGTFKFSGNSIDYSLDSGSTWVTLPSNTNTPAIQSGQTIMWKGELLSAFSNIGTFSSSSNFSVEGNIMSLLYGENFSGQTSLSGKNYIFVDLFQGCTTLTSAENLVLPATTLAQSCYSQMFRNCTSLTTPPKELPATTLANRCYASMFEGCTSLTTAPSTLPATTLVDECYYQMFKNCYNLTTAPSILPATTLAYRCYYRMFEGCESLTTAPELLSTTLAVGCYNGMFQSCYNLTTAPVLSASTLVTKCYNSMFYNCWKLNSITCLATNISASNCTENWVSTVAASGTFTKAASMTSWTSGVNGIPNGWTVQDA
jgi:hypothetical protein